jgi:hypothetical protein
LKNFEILLYFYIIKMFEGEDSNDDLVHPPHSPDKLQRAAPQPSKKPKPPVLHVQRPGPAAFTRSQTKPLNIHSVPKPPGVTGGRLTRRNKAAKKKRGKKTKRRTSKKKKTTKRKKV